MRQTLSQRYNYQKYNKRDKTSLERVEYFLRKKCENLAETFAAIHFLEKHPAKKYPQYYEDNTKGKMFGNFEHPEVVEYAQELVKKVKEKIK